MSLRNLLLETNGTVVVRRNRNATLNSRYADYADVIAHLRPFLARHEATFQVNRCEIINGVMRVSLMVTTDAESHAASYDIGIPEHNRGTSYAMTSGAAISYGSRYAAVAFFGLVTGDDDDAERASRMEGEPLEKDSAPIVRPAPGIPEALAEASEFRFFMSKTWQACTYGERFLGSMLASELLALWQEHPNNLPLLGFAADFCEGMLAKRGKTWADIDGGEDTTWPLKITGCTPGQLKQAISHVKKIQLLPEI